MNPGAVILWWPGPSFGWSARLIKIRADGAMARNQASEMELLTRP
jgi:hypothetical protein